MNIQRESEKMKWKLCARCHQRIYLWRVSSHICEAVKEDFKKNLKEVII